MVKSTSDIPAWGGTRVAVTMIVAATLTTLAACTDRDEPPQGSSFPNSQSRPFLPLDRLSISGSPPPATIRADGGEIEAKVVVIDWAAINPALSVAPPNRMEWPTVPAPASEQIIHVRIATSAIPDRVVAYEYGTVNQDGIPADGSGKETLCAWQGQDQPCSYGNTHTNRVEIRLKNTESRRGRGKYFVIQVAWFAATKNLDVDLPQVTTSWAFKIT